LGLGEYAVMAGIALVFVGIILLILGAVYGIAKHGGRTEVGGVILIGPIPIAFGTSSKALLASMALAVVLMILALILYSRLPRIW